MRKLIISMLFMLVITPLFLGQPIPGGSPPPPPLPQWTNVQGTSGTLMGSTYVDFDGDINLPNGNYPVLLYVEADGNGENAEGLDWENVNSVGGTLHAGFTEWVGGNPNLPNAINGWAFYLVVLTDDGDYMSDVVWVSK